MQKVENEGWFAEGHVGERRLGKCLFEEWREMCVDVWKAWIKWFPGRWVYGC